MGYRGNIAEVMVGTEAPFIQTEQERLVRIARRTSVTGGSTLRSDALQEAFEFEENQERMNVPYALPPEAVKMLGRILPESDAAARLFSPSDAARIVDGLLILRGEVRQVMRRYAPLDYKAGLTVLFSEGATVRRITDEVFHKNDTASAQALLGFAKKCAQRRTEDITTVDDIILLADPEYEIVRLANPNADPQNTEIAKEPRRPRNESTPKDDKPTYKSGVPEDWFLAPVNLGMPRPPQRRRDDDNPLAWQVDALCSQTDPEAFFPEKGGSTRDAKRICASCEVSGDCLEYALQNDERFGIWGGLSERERRKLKRRAG